MRRTTLALALLLPALAAAKPRGRGWLTDPAPPRATPVPAEPASSGGLTMTTLEVGGGAVPAFAPYDAVSYRPDGRQRAARTRDNRGVEVSETVLGLDGVDFGRRDAEVTALRYGPRGEVLAAGYRDGAVLLFEPDTGALRGEWRAGEGEAVVDVAAGPGGAWVAALVGSPARLHVFPEAPAWKPSWPVSVRGSRCLLATAQGELVVAGPEAIRVVDFSQPPEAWQRLDSEGPVTSLAASPDGQRLAAGAAKGPVWLYRRAASGAFLLEQVWHGGAGLASQGIAFSADGKLLAASQADDPLRLTVVNADSLASVAWYRVMLQPPRAIAFMPDHRSVAYAGGLSTGIGGNYLTSEAYQLEIDTRKQR